jgi:hypothetical protein
VQIFAHWGNLESHMQLNLKRVMFGM